MLAYFHYCNKGSHPFIIDWTQQTNIAFAKFDAEQVKFMQEIKAEIDNRGTSSLDAENLSQHAANS
jgi:hypothetical protein